MKFTTSGAVLALPSLSLAATVLLPLYIYPSPISLWQPVYSAVSANPSVQFQIIVNPNSGPGSYPPTSDYVAAVANLTKYPNVLTLGYVDTAYGNKNISSIKSEIDTYAKWWYYTPQNISIDGIFFDDVTTNNNAYNFTLLKNATTYAYNTIPSDTTPVVLNPGTLAPTSYFGIADTVIEFENSFANYNNATTVSSIPKAYRSQSAILVYGVSKANVTAMNSYVHNMIANAIGYIYYVADACYCSDLSLVSSITAAVKAG